ncbi:MAG: hypothetical protein AAGF85_03100 [Bacteroidota bacterium]
MNKANSLTLGGIALLIAGIVMFTAERIGIGTAKFLIPLLFIASGIFSLIFSNTNPQTKKISQYHIIHGIGLILSGVLLGLLPKSLADFLRYATYFILAFGLLEIIIGFALANSGSRIDWKHLILRFSGGFLGIIGAVLILATAASDKGSALMITGFATALIGINSIIFSTKTHKLLAA